jgi:hypothetical protein
MSAIERRFFGLTHSHINAGFVAGTTSTYTTTASTNAVIGGKFCTVLTAQTNTASPTTDAATGAAFLPLTPNKATVLVWGINAAGAIKVCQGSIEDTEVGITTTVGAFRNPPQWPSLPDDFVPMAYQLCRTAPSAATWTPCTSSWTASGVTCTAMVNVAQLPDRPQIT